MLPLHLILLFFHSIIDKNEIDGKYKKQFNSKKITIPLVKRYCQGTVLAASIFLTTYGPNDQNNPANNTIGTAAF